LAWPEGAEEFAEVRREQVRLLERREVAACPTGEFVSP
jgi:hypothetical protein